MINPFDQKLYSLKQIGLKEWSLFVFVIAIMVRVFGIGDIPRSVGQDEASTGYDAWVLLTEGVDQHGVSWEKHLFSSRVDQHALYSYIAMPFIAIGGLNTTALRLPAALLGIMCLWIFWQLGKRLDKQMAFWVLLAIATSPWHIMASRWALGSNLLPSITLIACYCFIRASTNMAWLPVASAILALTSYMADTAYCFAPLFMFCAWIMIAKEQKIPHKWLSLSMLCAVLIALPNITAIVINTWGLEHFGGAVTGAADLPEAQYNGTFLPLIPNGFARIPDNAIQVLHMLLGAQSDGSLRDSSSSWGAQYWVLTPFLLLGIAYAINHKTLTDRLMLGWLCCALITSFLNHASINKINIIWIPSLWLAARGLWLLHPYARWNRLAQIALSCLGIIFVLHYFYSWQERISQSLFLGFGESLQAATKEAPSGHPITITNRSDYASFLFFTKPKLSEVLAASPGPISNLAVHNANNLGRFKFGITNEQLSYGDYWIAHISELQLFSLMNFNIQSFGSYAWITRKPTQELKCYESLELAGFYGKQDVGNLGINYEVESTVAGLPIAEQYFYAGLGVHGDSKWSMDLAQPAYALEVGIGLSSNSGCSDGIVFKLLADDKQVFSSQLMKPGALEFHNIALGQAQKLTFITEAGYSNRCDHGLWITPVIRRCNK